MYKEARAEYNKSSDLMLNFIQDCKSEKVKKKNLQTVKEIIKRVEEIDKIIKNERNDEKKEEDEKTPYEFRSEEIEIEEDSTGYDFECLFEDYLDDKVTNVQIFEHHIKNDHQIMNLVRFLEVLVEKTSVKCIHLTTGRDAVQRKQEIQKNNLDKVKESLKGLGVDFVVEMCAFPQHRKIILNNGWTVDMSEGLDIFKQPKDLFSLGSFDLKYRKCHKATFHFSHNTSHN